MSTILESVNEQRPDLIWERRCSSLFAGLKPNDREEFAVYWPTSALKESVFVERISPKRWVARDVEKVDVTATGETAALAVEGLEQDAALRAELKQLVVNVRVELPDVYVGRGCGRLSASKWGNPFPCR